jgi:hypothetical protein
MDFAEGSAGLDDDWTARGLGGGTPAFSHAFVMTLKSKCRPESGERQFRRAAARHRERVQRLPREEERVWEQRVELGRGRA